MPLKPNRLKLVVVVEPQGALKSFRPVGTVVSAIKLLPRIEGHIGIECAAALPRGSIAGDCGVDNSQSTAGNVNHAAVRAVDILAEGALLDWGGIALVC